MGLCRWRSGKESTANVRDAGDMGSTPGLGRFPEGANGSPLGSQRVECDSTHACIPVQTVWVQCYGVRPGFGVNDGHGYLGVCWPVSP